MRNYRHPQKVLNGISCNSFLHFYDLWKKHGLEKNCIYLEEFAENISGTGILDNDDFCEDTLIGSNMSYNTDVMSVRPENLEVTISDSERDMQPLPTSPEDLKLLYLEQHPVQSCRTVSVGNQHLALILILDVRTQMYRDKGELSMLW